MVNKIRQYGIFLGQAMRKN